LRDMLANHFPESRSHHDAVLLNMYEARPSMKRQWSSLMKERQSFHDVLLKSLD
jgi:hypothetical protein